MHPTFLALLLASCVFAGPVQPLLAQQELVGWGLNNYGQIDIPATPPGVTYVDYEGGYHHNIARRSDGVVLGWGWNWFGQCDVPALPAGVQYTKFAAGRVNSFACTSAGSVVVWGSSIANLHNVPSLLPSLSYVDIFSGTFTDHVLALRSDGWLVAWGDNSYGQCDVPGLPPTLTYVKAAAGWAHSVALRSDGSVVDWGVFSQGSVPSLPPGVIYTDVAAGNDYSIALRSDGVVVAWGDNSYGQCNVPAPPPGVTFTAIAAGPVWGLALRSDGAVASWGSSPPPMTLPPLVRCLSIRAGGAHAIGLAETVCGGSTYCTPKTNLIGCVPSMSYTGSTSMTGPDDFYITASNLTSQQAGIMIWSTSPYSALFYGGRLCVAPPIIRTLPLNSGGNGAPFDCTGTYSFHFSDAYMAAQGITPGIARYAQFWMRDTHDPLQLHVGLSNGLEFMICP